MADTAKPVPAQTAPVEDSPTLQAPTDQPAGQQQPESPFAEPDLAVPGLDDLEGRARHEYGRYVALQAITVGGALAFTEGSPVPRSHPQVAQWVADGMVRDLDAVLKQG